MPGKAADPPALMTLIALSGLSVVSLNMFLPSLANIAREFQADYALVNLCIAGYAAVSCVLLTNVVLLAAPFHRTTEAETKLVPSTVKVRPAPPAGASLGETEPIVGSGLLTAKFAALDVPPPGAAVETLTVSVAPCATSDAWSVVVSWVGVTKLVVRAPLSIWMTERGTKSEPLTVRSCEPLPAAACAGLSEPIAGARAGS